MPSGIFSEPAGSEELDALIREYIREAEANSEEGVVIVPDVPVSGTLSYERFRELMDQVNRLIGGHSAYDPEYLEHSTRVPQTYEGALEEYSAIVEKDRYTGRLPGSSVIIWACFCPFCRYFWRWPES